MTARQRTISALLGIGICAALIWGLDEAPKLSYYHNQGKVFGTYYNIRYEAAADLEDSIQAAFTAFDNSLSLFNHHSILSAINENRDTLTNAYFETMWAEAERVYALSGGAFDITVAPLVNYWGFGKKDRNPSLSLPSREGNKDIDSLLDFVGFEKVQLIGHKVVKADPRVQIDGGAVAKGQACDMIAEVLRKNGCTNYLVDIGGEVVAHGVNDKGNPWHIGITKPNLNNDGAQEELQEILAVNDICMATSGNYRRFYYKNGRRYAHTINPKSGQPVDHSLLSATVMAKNCATADAYATAFMVMGTEKAKAYLASHPELSAYLIYTDKKGQYATWHSPQLSAVFQSSKE